MTPLTEADLEVARQVLARCAAHDPWFPNPDPMVVATWAQQFTESRLRGQALIEGVFRAYRDNGSGFRPLPKDIIVAARAVLSEKQLRWSDEERAEFEALCDAKAQPEPPALPAPVACEALTGPAGSPGRANPAETISGRISALAARMGPERAGQRRGAYYPESGTVPAEAARAIAARRSAPPAPVPCPDCNSVEPCSCDENNTTTEEVEA